MDKWTQQFMQTYPVLMGDGAVHQKIWTGYGSTIGLPFNLILDRNTMQVKGKLGSPTYQAAADLCDME